MLVSVVALVSEPLVGVEGVGMYTFCGMEYRLWAGVVGDGVSERVGVEESREMYAIGSSRSSRICSSSGFRCGCAC
jgi:hypothetical protein